VPRYLFCCESCGATFEVSRPMSDAGADAQCATNFNRPSAPPSPPRTDSYSHFGHSHGPGAARHSHGPSGKRRDPD
jgi:hypothetical protein